MKTRIIILCFLIFISLPTQGQTNEYKIFTDSLTEVQLFFPSSAKFENISPTSFRKGIAVMEKSDIIIYSMRNPDEEQYSWSRINEFTQNSKYGSHIRDEKINNSAEGWFRYYKNKTKKGRDYVTCVTLIRGNIYALYLVESAYRESDLKSKEVVALSSFPKSKLHHLARKKTLSINDLIIILAIILSGLCLWKFRRKINKTWKVILIVISSLIIVSYLIFFAWFTITLSIGFGVINALFWGACLYSNSWSEFWHKIGEMFKNFQ